MNLNKFKQMFNWNNIDHKIDYSMIFKYKLQSYIKITWLCYIYYKAIIYTHTMQMQQIHSK